MTPGSIVEEEQIPRGLSQSVIDDDSIVISGISGMFPECKDVKEFSENLYNKVYMVTDKARYKYNHPELQNYNGIIPDLEPFDGQFFSVHAKLCKSTDSMSRKLLEQSYQAIFDAGLSIDEVKKTKLGVFTGACFSESSRLDTTSAFDIIGGARAMFANRISYWLDGKGPSISFDALDCSSIVALKYAIEAIRSGKCDAAIVGSANLCLRPQFSIHYGRVMQQSPDGKVRSLCKDADGSARSEAINVLFLQKAKDAKRIYSEICHAECKFVPDNTEGLTHLRSVPQMRNFFKEFYQHANVAPNEVEYIEAFGTAIPEVDKNELEAIGEVFCKDRSEPLLVGSVMSNMGYTEAASGISSIIKICLAYHTGQIAANLHCDNPRDDIEALRDGRMKVVDTHMPTRHSYCAVNSFSLGGLNGHVLLKGHKKESKCYNNNVPYLVTISGRHEEAVKTVVDDLKSHPADPEQIALLHNIHERVTSGHTARGYCIITPQENNETKLIVEKYDYYGDLKRPIWFVYSGMGSQWAGMGAELMRIPIFAAAIERCRIVLEPLGVDIVDIISNPDKKTFDNILNSFVGIAAVQIGLTDILQELGIVPDKIIGHSVGEMGCAYADGCFTTEEMILAAYSRGLVSIQTPFIHGSMAAVGLGYNVISRLCPPEIEVACHNSSESSTISGPSDIMKKFVDKITAQGIFAKEVPCSNIAYHSRYIAEAGPKLKEYFLKVIPDSKPRSAKWLSTSIPQDKWHLDSAQYSSAEYHTNNLLNPVLFEETSRLIPSNAITIEIAPHGLLQAILKRSLGAACTNIALTRRGHSDPLTFLLISLGDMYMVGLNPKLQRLYQKVQFPVSTGTGALSHMVKWAHTESWPIPFEFERTSNILVASQRTFVISTYDDEQKYLEGHVIEGHVTYPLSALLVIIWETLTMVLQTDKEQSAVEFEDVHYYEDVIIRKDEVIRLTVTIHKGSGRFQVNRANNVLIEGSVKSITKAVLNPLKRASMASTAKYELDSQDIYKLLFKRGYYYMDSFKSIKKSDLQFKNAEVTWNNNWVTLIDSLIQLNILSKEHDGIAKPRYIRSLVIDSMKHRECLRYCKDLKVSFNELANISKCGGVVMEDIKFIYGPQNSSKNVLKRIEFMPFSLTGNVDLDSILHAHIQLMSENIIGNTINAVNIINQEEEELPLGDKVKSISNELLDVNMELQNVSEKNLVDIESFDSLDLIIGFDFIQKLLSIPSLRDIVPNNVFILNLSKVILTKEDVNKVPITIISTANTSYGYLTLVRWQPVVDNSKVTCISMENECRLLQYTRDNLTEKDRLIITTTYPAATELKDLVRKWSKENEKNKVNLYMSDNKMLSDEHLFEATRKGLTFNVSVNGKWGLEFYLPLENSQITFRDLKLVNNGNNLDSLEWVETDSDQNHGVCVKVHYAGVNYYDAQKATGLIPCQNNETITFGLDFSGLTETGQRVMGITKSGSLTTIVNTDPNLLWPVPEHWSLEDAATVPYPYLHAFYCLVTKGDIQPRCNVMIHGGAGALGQAVISIALSMDCKVYTTVSNLQKKKFLLRLYPELSEHHIGNSKDESFQEMILEGTKGKGCAIVINCLKEPLRHCTMSCVGFEGRFIDINPETTKNSPFGMSFLAKSKSYWNTKFDHIFEERNAAQFEELHRMLTEGIIKGYVRPLTRVSYSPTETVRAFRLLKGSNHRGRVLLRMQELKHLPIKQSLSCCSEKSYVILCGKQEFGLDVVDRMVLRNARKLTIHCDPSFSVGLMQRYVKSWQNIGVQVKINKLSLNLDDNHTALIKDSLKMGQVEGIFVIDQYDTSIVDAIEKTSRKLCPDLKYFTMLKVGKEQFDIAETNILKDRSKNNLPTLLLQLPALYTYDAVDTYQVPQTIHSALNAIETALGVKQYVPISTYSVGKTNVDVLEDISVLLGINIPNTLRANTTLGELGVDDEGSEKVITYLEKTFNLLFNKEDVPDFTIATILNMPQLSRNKQKVNEVKDLSTFFTIVDPEEINSTVDMKVMPTIVLQRSDEINCNETYMVIIPGMEGHYGMFLTLCERLKISAVVLQPAVEHAIKPIPDVADHLIKIMKKKLNINGKRFFICGYSYGALVGLEMAALLEKQGYEGTVFCLDSAPDVFKQQLANVIGEMSEEQLQNAVIEHMFTLMSNVGGENLKEDLQEASTWKEKLDICKRHLHGRVSHSTQYSNLLVEAAYGRICSSRSYIPTKSLSSTKLNSLVILLKGLVPQELVEVPDDFGLSNYTKTAPVVYQLASSHSYVPHDLGCSNIINRHLGKDILQEFANKNICDTSFLDKRQ